MFEQLMDSFRKTSESSMQMQQEMLTHWAQQWLAAPPNAAGVSAEWGRNLQKRWSELALEMLNKHREALDSSYKSGIQIIEQTLRVSEAKSADDYRRLMEELWRNSFDVLKANTEAQLREFPKWIEKSIEMAQQAKA